MNSSPNEEKEILEFQNAIKPWYKKHLKIILGLLTFLSLIPMCSFSWQFALVIMFAVGTHEYGHVLAMTKAGIKNKGFFFIPFLGGVTVPAEPFGNQLQYMFMCIAGPASGLIISFLLLILFWVTGLPILAAIALTISALNLGNLLPLPPLDGGQLLRAFFYSIHPILSKLYGPIIFISALLISFKVHIVLFIICFIFAAYDSILQIIAYFFMKIERPQPIKHKLNLIVFVAYLAITFGLTGITLYLVMRPEADIPTNFLGYKPN